MVRCCGNLAVGPHRSMGACPWGAESLADQEREDHVHEGTYSELVRSGGLAVDAGRAVPGIDRLLSRIWGWEPLAISLRQLQGSGAAPGRRRSSADH